MHLLVAFSLFTACLAAPQGYSASTRSGAGFNNAVFVEPGFDGELRGGISGGVFGIDGHGGNSGANCGRGQVRHVDGSCVEPIVNRNYFVYNAPDLPVDHLPLPQIPHPKVEYNVVFVRTPEGPEGVEPIVVPPPQQKTLVYVLSKSGQLSQQVIEVPAGPEQTPEVFYINYDEGDNPTLPGGFDLQSVLASAISQQGQVIEGQVGSGIEGGAGVSFGAVGGAGLGNTHGVGFGPGVISTHSTGPFGTVGVNSIGVSEVGSLRGQPSQYYESQ